jgi:DNA-binding NarL/FixJ family response regulator
MATVQRWVRQVVDRTGASGSEAAEQPDAAEAIDVAVVDLGLPDVSGAALCEVIHQFYPSLPVLVYSGQATPEDVRRTKGAWVRQILPKPVDRGELLAAVEAVLA